MKKTLWDRIFKLWMILGLIDIGVAILVPAIMWVVTGVFTFAMFGTLIIGLALVLVSGIGMFVRRRGSTEPGIRRVRTSRGGLL